MKRLMSFVPILLAMLTASCSTMTPARYSVSIDNNQVLKQFAGAKVLLANLEPPPAFEANCRLVGPIEAKDGLTIPQFIQKAFNDEFKFANIFDEQQGVKLTGKVDKIEFSSASGLTNGWWDLAITLQSANGASMSTANRYNFKSGFDAITACNQTAQALTPAVQDLIYKTITDSRFGTLMK